MRIWIDLTSLPHIHFFRAFIKRQRRAGNEVIVTSREFGLMNDILDKNGIEYTSIGSHGGKGLASKLAKSCSRVSELARFISKHDPDIGLSKHSVESARVCFGLQIPSVMVIDHETAEAAMRLMVPLTDYIVSPEAIPAEGLRRFGARDISRFYGVCEVAHFYDFSPKKDVLRGLGISRGKKVVIARSEPMLSSHNDHQSTLFSVLEGMKDRGDVEIVFIPRGENDLGRFSQLDLIVPSSSIDTLSLYSAASMMIGAGSCMNREACIGGCPTISICPDDLPGVDRLLIDKRLMWHALRKDDIMKLVAGILDGKPGHGMNGRALHGFEDPYAMMEDAMRKAVARRSKKKE